MGVKRNTLTNGSSPGSRLVRSPALAAVHTLGTSYLDNARNTSETSLGGLADAEGAFFPLWYVKPTSMGLWSGADDLSVCQMGVSSDINPSGSEE